MAAPAGPGPGGPHRPRRAAGPAAAGRGRVPADGPSAGRRTAPLGPAGRRRDARQPADRAGGPAGREGGAGRAGGPPPNRHGGRDPPARAGPRRQRPADGPGPRAGAAPGFGQHRAVSRRAGPGGAGARSRRQTTEVDALRRAVRGHLPPARGGVAGSARRARGRPWRASPIPASCCTSSPRSCPSTWPRGRSSSRWTRSRPSSAAWSTCCSASWPCASWAGRSRPIPRSG